MIKLPDGSVITGQGFNFDLCLIKEKKVLDEDKKPTGEIKKVLDQPLHFSTLPGALNRYLKEEQFLMASSDEIYTIEQVGKIIQETKEELLKLLTVQV